MKKISIYIMILSVVIIVVSVFYMGNTEVLAASKAENAYNKLLSEGYYEYEGIVYDFSEQGVVSSIENIDGKGSKELIVSNHDTYNAGMYSLLFSYKKGKVKCVLAAYDLIVLGKKGYLKEDSEVHGGNGNEWVYKYSNGKIKEIASAEFDDGLLVNCIVKGKKVSESKYNKFVSKLE